MFKEIFNWKLKCWMEQVVFLVFVLLRDCDIGGEGIIIKVMRRSYRL